MNKFLVYPLLLLFIVQILMFASVGYESPLSNTGAVDEVDMGGGYAENITAPEGLTLSLFGFKVATLSFPINEVVPWNINDLFAGIVVVVGIIAILGLRVVNTGLSDTTQTVIMTFLIWGGLYALLSGLTFGLLDGMTGVWANIGTITLWSITLIYIVGLAQQLQGARSTI